MNSIADKILDIVFKHMGDYTPNKNREIKYICNEIDKRKFEFSVREAMKNIYTIEIDPVKNIDANISYVGVNEIKITVEVDNEVEIPMILLKIIDKN